MGICTLWTGAHRILSINYFYYRLDGYLARFSTSRVHVTILFNRLQPFVGNEHIAFHAYHILTPKCLKLLRQSTCRQWVSPLSTWRWHSVSVQIWYGKNMGKIWWTTSKRHENSGSRIHIVCAMDATDAMSICFHCIAKVTHARKDHFLHGSNCA